MVGSWQKNETVHSQFLVMAWNQLESAAIAVIMAATVTQWIKKLYCSRYIAFDSNWAISCSCALFPNTANRRDLGETCCTCVKTGVSIRARIQMCVHTEMGNAKQMPNKKWSTIGPSVWEGEQGDLEADLSVMSCRQLDYRTRPNKPGKSTAPSSGHQSASRLVCIRTER